MTGLLGRRLDKYRWVSKKICYALPQEVAGLLCHTSDFVSVRPSVNASSIVSVIIDTVQKILHQTFLQI